MTPNNVQRDWLLFEKDVHNSISVLILDIYLMIKPNLNDQEIDSACN